MGASTRITGKHNPSPSPPTRFPTASPRRRPSRRVARAKSAIPCLTCAQQRSLRSGIHLLLRRSNFQAGNQHRVSFGAKARCWASAWPVLQISLPILADPPTASQGSRFGPSSGSCAGPGCERAEGAAGWTNPRGCGPRARLGQWRLPASRESPATRIRDSEKRLRSTESTSNSTSAAFSASSRSSFVPAIVSVATLRTILYAACGLAGTTAVRMAPSDRGDGR
jgi:hypothetical protein